MYEWMSIGVEGSMCLKMCIILAPYVDLCLYRYFVLCTDGCLCDRMSVWICVYVDGWISPRKNITAYGYLYGRMYIMYVWMDNRVDRSLRR